MKTNQEIFTQVVTHLLTQNAKAVNNTGGCEYRTKEGLRCAVGCLIPVEKYDPRIEGVGVRDSSPQDHEEVRAKWDALRHILLTEGVDLTLMSTSHLLKRLQHLHDWKSPPDWKAHLKLIAADCGLQMPEDLPQ